MDGWTDRQTGGEMDRQTDGWRDGQTDKNSSEFEMMNFNEFAAFNLVSDLGNGHAFSSFLPRSVYFPLRSSYLAIIP